MVKGTSRQVILVASPDKKLFEQAIFILKEDAPMQGITDEMLLKEAKRAIGLEKRRNMLESGPLWACGGALFTALVWLVTWLL